MDKKCLYLHRWFKAALKSELIPLVWTFPMEFSWVGTLLAALMGGYEALPAHFAESAWKWWISCQLCSSIPCPYLEKTSPKKQWMKIIPSGQCIYNYPAAFPGLDGRGKQQALLDTEVLLCATAPCVLHCFYSDTTDFVCCYLCSVRQNCWPELGRELCLNMWSLSLYLMEEK